MKPYLQVLHKRLADSYPVRQEAEEPRVAAVEAQPDRSLSGFVQTTYWIVGGLAGVSGIINILALTGSLFMLQVYDRVLPSHSAPTLVALMVLAGILYAFQASLEIIRSRILVRVGNMFDEHLSARIQEIVAELPLRVRNTGDGLQPIRDMDQVRTFVSGAAPLAVFDLPWMLIYVAVCFAFHPWIGYFALASIVLLATISIAAETMMREPARLASTRIIARNNLADDARRNAEAVRAMGMAPQLRDRWTAANASYLEARAGLSDLEGTFSVTSRVLRLALQSGILALGAFLILQGSASGGVMIASSIVLSRALAPVELVIANSRNFIATRQSWMRLKKLLAAMPSPQPRVKLLPPAYTLAAEGVSASAPGDARRIVKGVSFELSAGDGLGIIGPSASGKSSLARLLVGAWRPLQGAVRIDGASLDQWTPRDLGRHIGYLPQNIELFAGTIAQNIGRFDPNADSAAIINAAKIAGIEDIVLRLPDGYETEVGDAGSALSAGQRQRVALARALYGDPFIVVLDEPNSNLDREGEEALTTAVMGVRQRGGIVVVVAHRLSMLGCLNKILVMNEGSMQAYGPREQVFNNRRLQESKSA